MFAIIDPNGNAYSYDEINESFEPPFSPFTVLFSEREDAEDIIKDHRRFGLWEGDYKVKKVKITIEEGDESNTK